MNLPDPSFVLPLLLQSAVIPFVAAAAASMAAPDQLRQRAQSESSTPSRSVFAALAKNDMIKASALAVGFLASFFAIYYAQWSPAPRQALDWMPWILALAVPGIVHAERLPAPALKLLGCAVVTAAALALIAWPALAGLGIFRVATAIVAGSALTLVFWRLSTGRAERPGLTLLPLIITSGCAALALMLDSSQLLGQLAGALAAVLVALTITGWLRQHAENGHAVLGLGTLLLAMLLLNAYLYAGFPLSMIALLVGSLLAAGLLQGMHLPSRHIKISQVVANTICLVAGIITVALAFQAMQESGGY